MFWVGEIACNAFLFAILPLHEYMRINTYADESIDIIHNHIHIHTPTYTYHNSVDEMIEARPEMADDGQLSN